MQQSPIDEEPSQYDGKNKEAKNLDILIKIFKCFFYLCFLKDSEADIDEIISDSDDEIDLLYDPALNCYYDPRTGTYYEVNLS